MKLVRCEKNKKHYYDVDKHDCCPLCEEKDTHDSPPKPPDDDPPTLNLWDLVKKAKEASLADASIARPRYCGNCGESLGGDSLFCSQCHTICIVIKMSREGTK